MSSHNEIEPPHIIENKVEGLKVVLQIIAMLDHTASLPEQRPVVGMLYLKFNSEAEANDWNDSFRVLVNDHWCRKLKKSKPLHIMAISKECAKDTLDVLFAETDEVVRDMASMRFSGHKF